MSQDDVDDRLNLEAASELSTAERERKLYTTDSVNLTGRELGLILETEQAQTAKKDVEDAVSAVVGWTSLSLVGLAIFVVSLALDTLELSPVLFERAFGCQGEACGVLLTVSVPNIANWAFTVIGALITALGLVRLRFDRVIKVRLAYDSLMARFRSRQALRPVFVGAHRVKYVITPHGLKVIAGAREFAAPWSAFDGVDLMFDEVYNADPPDSFANKSKLDRLELEAFLHNPALPPELAAFKEAAAAWAAKNSELRLPLRLTPNDLKPPPDTEADKRGPRAEAGRMREYLLLPSRAFTDTVEGLSWDDAVPAILYMIFSRDPSVKETREARLSPPPGG